MVTNEARKTRRQKKCRQSTQNCGKNKTQHIGRGAPERHRHIKTFNIIDISAQAMEKQDGQQ